MAMKSFWSAIGVLIIVTVLLTKVVNCIYGILFGKYPTTGKTHKCTLSGPFNLFLLGYLPFISEMPHKKFQLLSQKYGKIFRIKLGQIETVVLNDYQSIAEAFKKDEFLGRPENIAFNVLTDLQGMGTLSGTKWREQKRFTMFQMRNLGFGKYNIESHIKDNIHCIIEKIDRNGNNQPINARLLFEVDNFSITKLLFGASINKNDCNYLKLQDSITNAIRSLGQVSVLTFFPKIVQILSWTKLVPFVNNLKSDFETVNLFIKNEITNHENSITEQVRDYIDSFLLELHKHKQNNPTTFTKRMLAGNVQGFLAAGIETVKTTLEWSLLILASYQSVQDKVYHELISVCGNAEPSWSKRASLVYTQATINEIQRWKTISPLNLMRMTTEQVTLGTHRIQKGVHVIANLWAVHFDATYWNNPCEFNPDRFISIDNQLIKHDRFIPFSIGKRSCPGESMAQMEIFLILTCLVQKYRIISAPGNSFDEVLGLTLQARNKVYLKFEKRS